MGVNITIEPTDDVPVDSRVCHYDELGEDAKDAFPLLTERCQSTIDAEVANAFRGCELIKYTDYYEITFC